MGRPFCIMVSCLVALLLAMPNALADSASAETAIRTLVLDHAGASPSNVSVDFPGNPAVLQGCGDATAFLPHGNLPQRSRVTLGLSCSNAPATRYLPVEIVIEGRYVRVREQIDPGTTIEAPMLELATGDLNGMAPGTLTAKSAAIGKVARQRLTTGSAVRDRHLETPALVERGQRVTIVAQGTGFQVSRSGEAMQAGRSGERIRVQVASRQHLKAVVIGPGQVSVSP